MSDLTIYYVDDVENGAPYLTPRERPEGVRSVSARSVVANALPDSVAREDVVWVVKYGTPAHGYLREHAQGRISSFSASKAQSWLSLVAAGPTGCSTPAEDCRPAVKATGLGSTDNGKRSHTTINVSAGQVIVDSSRITASKLLADQAIIKEPAKPHTTLITQVDVHDVSPVNDTLYNALEVSKLEGMDGDQFPEDGNITIQWSKVHGRTNLRKFTITIDYKESN